MLTKKDTLSRKGLLFRAEEGQCEGEAFPFLSGC